MSISFYDTSVRTYIQVLESAIAVMQRATEHFDAGSIDDLLEFRLVEDMLPFAFQINSIRHHSLGALEGMKVGEFAPPPKMPANTFAECLSYLEEALAQLKAVSEDEVNALQDKEMWFRLGKEMELPFITQNFVASFSLPNLMFHATTLYDMLRIKGVPLGKMDFLGQMRIGH